MQATSQARKISSIKEKLFVSYLKSERTCILSPSFFFMRNVPTVAIHKRKSKPCKEYSLRIIAEMWVSIQNVNENLIFRALSLS